MAFMEFISNACAGLCTAASPVVLVVATGSARVANISIFNTGVDAGGNVLANGTLNDLTTR